LTFVSTGNDGKSLEQAVRELLDRQAIVDVLHRYCHLVDVQQLDRMVEEVFAPDGSDDHGEGPVVGRRAIRDWFVDNTANIAGNAHNISNVMIELDGDRATMRSTVTSWTWTREHSGAGALRPADYVLVLNYVDELSRYPEGWRIDRRVLVSNGESVVGIGSLPPTQRGIHALASKTNADAGDGRDGG
jgi:hypothetical protein